MWGTTIFTFFSDGHSGLTDISTQVIDYTDTRDPTVGEGFWVYKLNCFVLWDLIVWTFKWKLTHVLEYINLDQSLLYS